MLLGLSVFVFPTVFMFFLLFFLFFMLTDYSWLGLFFYCDSWVFILLIFMSLFIMGIVVYSEDSLNLILLSEVLVFICVMFFIPSNMMMLYIFFELSMFPILVMILGYGSQIEKINSAYYLIFYASFCSLPFLFVYFNSYFWLMSGYYDLCFSWEMLFILSLSFMMKFPVFFLHLWLPKAHVEAPTTASMLLAGLLLKLGTCGFLRILGSIGFLHVNMWMVLAFLGMVMASFSCMFQSDAKALAAYSSIAHMSFLLMSLLFVFMSGKVSGLVMMLAHGYTSALLFYMVGEYYHSSSTRIIYFMNGCLSSSLIFSLCFSLVLLSNMGVPPSMSFMAEFVAISGGLNMNFNLFVILFVYFFFSFYYSIYFLTNFLMGMKNVGLGFVRSGFSLPALIMMFNMFWMSVLY